MRSAGTFFGLVVALTVPFWLLGAATGLELLPGLPIAALAAGCPALAALILVRREQGGARALLASAVDFRRIRPSWYLPILLVMPAERTLSWLVLRWTGTPVPVPHFELVPTLALTASFFVAALGEELGWSGYALDPLEERWGALRASLILGAFWAAYHYVALVQAHRSVEWIAWWSIGTIAARVILVWLYDHTDRSVLATALFHTTINLAWQLFPVNGSFYDPRVSSLILAAIAATVVSGLRR